MVCTSNDLSNWEDFPKGLKVLLLDEDADSTAQTRSKLESMEYVVSVFSNVEEALLAFSQKPENFHIAIVEVGENTENEGLKFLEAAKDLPTVMTSEMQCLSTMMKCIALGAVEFLHKPLSDEKLKNIWQHVVHKAFSVSGNERSAQVKSGKVSTASMLQVKTKGQNSGEKKNFDAGDESGAQKYPAPSTPQQKQGVWLFDDGDFHDNANCSPEKESGNQDMYSKSVETTIAEASIADAVPISRDGDAVVKEEKDEAIDTKSDNSGLQMNGDNDGDSASEIPDKGNGAKNTNGTKTNRKKVDWTRDLHSKFVQAVEQLGVDHAIPSRILELMKVEGLTRHNIASHLQKYRMHRRNILPKEDERRWIQPKQQMFPGYYYPNSRPVMAYPYQSQSPNPARPVYHVWGVPPGPGVQMWGSPNYTMWQPGESNWHWRPYAGIQSNAWGCPVMPQANGSMHPPSHENITTGFRTPAGVDNSFIMPDPNTLDFHPDEEEVDKVVREAMSKPWLPLPLGLKPPSTDGVLSELSKQGIGSVPTRVNGSRLR